MLSSGNCSSLIITGKGGVGKTRLMLEIGRLAQRKGWEAYVAKPKLTTQDLDNFLSTISQNTSVILLFDYIETQNDFASIVER